MQEFSIKVGMKLGIFAEIKARILHLPLFLKVMLEYTMIEKLCSPLICIKHIFIKLFTLVSCNGNH